MTLPRRETSRTGPAVGAKRAPRRPAAFTLIEAIVTMVILSVAVPPALSMLGDAAAARRNSVAATRASWLATAVLEHILADMHSGEPGLGFEALADPNTYLNGFESGLVTRLKVMGLFYQERGVTYTVTIGGLFDRAGAVTGDPGRDVYRYVQVTATWTSTFGDPAEFTVGAMVTDL